MRKLAGLAIVLSLLWGAALIHAQQQTRSASNFITGVNPRNLQFKPYDTTKIFRRQAGLSMFNLGRLFPRPHISLEWPPKIGFSKFPDSILQPNSSFPTELFPFPQEFKILDSSVLPTMKVSTSQGG